MKRPKRSAAGPLFWNLRRVRAGVSLLEVLISIFVLSIGLLGVAAVIPVGRFAIVETAKSDRASACGHAVLNDIKVRRMLNPNNWRTPDGDELGSLNPILMTGYGNERRGFLLGESYAIDSLYVASNNQPPTGSSKSHWNDFPYNDRAPGAPFASWARLQRVAWTEVHHSVAGVSRLLAATVYQWHDDLRIPVAAEETQRPAQYMLTDSVGNELRPEIAGDYGWLATVSPAAETYDFVKYMDVSATDLADNLPYTYPENAPLYDISVAVFYKRDFTIPTGDFGDEPPAERQVQLQFLSGGLGGGDVRLFSLRRSFGLPAAGGARDGPEYLDVKKNEWMMVHGWFWYEFFNDDPSVMSLARIRVGVHKWYRIVAAGETTSEDLNDNGAFDPGETDYNGNGRIDWFREVTLAGPDWNVSWFQSTYGGYYATLLSGVVGVYSATVEF